MPSRAVKVNPIAIMDFILTWEGVGRDEKRGMRSGVGGGEGKREVRREGKEGKGMMLMGLCVHKLLVLELPCCHMYIGSP